jgi:GntR family transcriptional regulator/MocR family aminotransferase
LVHSVNAEQESGPVGGADLYLDLRGPGLRAGLMNALREAIRTARLAPGSRLPSSRALGADLGIARNTVVQAYSELTAEGWLTAQQGAETRVALLTVDVVPAATPPARAINTRHVHDLRPGRPDLSAFPRTEWIRAARRAISRAPDDAFGYAGPLGRPELRAALAEYLARTRGVRAHPDRVVICSGAAHGFALLAQVLRRQGVEEIAVEAYGLDPHRRLLTAEGLRTRPVPLDGQGAQIGHLEDLPRAGAVLLTPSHQFPTGVALHPDRRAAVVDWARRTDGLVIEDDYDGEFRYDRHPIGAVQGLDSEHIAYVGTTSKSLAPGLRLGWLVLPERLVDAVAAVKGDNDLTSGVIDQLTMAEFIESGAYDRHVRAMRLRYRNRRDQLVDALATHSPESRVTGITAGLHMLVELPSGNESAVVQGSAWQDLAMYGLAEFRHPDVPADRDALVIGYGTPSASAWSGALDALCRVLP